MQYEVTLRSIEQGGQALREQQAPGNCRYTICVHKVQQYRKHAWWHVPDLEPQQVLALIGSCIASSVTSGFSSCGASCGGRATSKAVGALEESCEVVGASRQNATVRPASTPPSILPPRHLAKTQEKI